MHGNRFCISKDINVGILDSMNTIKVRKLQYLGHVMRGVRYNLFKKIIQGSIGSEEEDESSG